MSYFLILLFKIFNLQIESKKLDKGFNLLNNPIANIW